MEYQRFLEFVERFFAKAGTVLRKKGRDYSAPEGAPSYVLVDKGRQTYYLLEIASGSVASAGREDLRRAIEAYAAKEGVAPYVCSLFFSLGYWLQSPSLPEVKKTIQLDGLEQQACLVSSEDLRYEIEDYMQEKGISYQTVPFKDILCIYFFTPEASDKFIDMYNSLELDNVEDEAPESNGFSDNAPNAPMISFPIMEPVVEENPSTSIAESLEEVASGDIPGADEIRTSVFRERYKKHQIDEKKEDSEAFGKDELREISRIKESIEKEEKNKRGQNGHIGRKEAKFYKICNILWSLLAYTPATIVNFFSKGRLVPAVLLLIACILVLAGLYYYPLAVLLAPLKELLLHEVDANAEYLMIFFSTWDSADVLMRIAADGHEPYLRNLSSFTMSIFYFDSGLVNFLNSEYYLRFICAAGYLLAIAPIWRGFGLRLVAFSLSFYIVYMPMLLAGSMAIANVSVYGNQAIDHAQTNSSVALAILNSSFVSIAVIALAVPLFSAFLAAKISKHVPEFLRHG
jgi:hypothetical protein